MSLFKYVTLSRVDILQNQEIRYTQPGAFNDPFEMPAFLVTAIYPDIFAKYVADQLPNRLRQHYEQLPSAIKEKISVENFCGLAEREKKPINEHAKQFIELATPRLRDSLRAFDQQVGILSLTESPMNLLMWSHYANEHRGMVIEFDEKHSSFNDRRSPNDEFGYLRRVKYTDDRPVGTLLDFDFADFFLTKSTEWSYEKEWRILRPTSDAVRHYTASPYNICLFRLPSTAIRRIILGARVTEPEIKEIAEFVGSAAHFTHVAIDRIRLDERHFSLNLEPVRLALP